MLAAKPASGIVGCTRTAQLLAHPDFSWSADMNTFSAASLWEVPKRSLGEFCLVDSKRSPAGQPGALGRVPGATPGAPGPPGLSPAADAQAHCSCYLLHTGTAGMDQAITPSLRQQARAELQSVVPHAVAPHHWGSYTQAERLNS